MDSEHYRFPKDWATKIKWIRYCNLVDNDDVSRLKICSKHFKSDCFIEVNAKQFGKNYRLKPFSVPSLVAPKPVKKASVHQGIVCVLEFVYYNEGFCNN